MQSKKVADEIFTHMKVKDATPSSREDGVLPYKAKLGWAAGAMLNVLHSVRGVYWNTFLLEVRGTL